MALCLCYSLQSSRGLEFFTVGGFVGYAGDCDWRMYSVSDAKEVAIGLTALSNVCISYLASSLFLSTPRQFSQSSAEI